MKKIVFIAFILLIAGCTTVRFGVHELTMGEYKLDPSHSMAWNISTAAKKESFKDIKSEYIAKNITGNENWKWKIFSDSENNLSLVDLSTIMPSYNVFMSSQDFEIDGLFVWVPTELAKTDDDARELLIKTIEDAIKKTYGNALNKYSNRDNKEGYFENKSILNIALSGVYDQTQRRANIYFDEKNKNRICDFSGYDVSDELKCSNISIFQRLPRGIYKTPSFLPLNTSGKSYLFTPRSDIGSLSSFKIYLSDSSGSSAINERKIRIITQKLSENLPAWFVFYFKPMYKAGLPAMVIMGGKTYFFVTQ
ncbi:hypothetical protein AB7W58_22910 [Providencia rettgeri]